MATYLLENEGYQVWPARTGEKGLEIARAAQPELLIVDVTLPGMDGFEVCRQLRQFSDAYVVMVTGRDEDVERALAEAGVELVRTGSPYAVAPGRVTTRAGEPYAVFTPFSRAWHEHGWRAPIDAPRHDAWAALDRTVDLPTASPPDRLDLPAAGEAAARRRWRDFLERVADYDAARDRPDINGTSHLSPHLRWGELHPRTLLADLGRLRCRRVERVEPTRPAGGAIRRGRRRCDGWSRLRPGSRSGWCCATASSCCSPS